MREKKGAFDAEWIVLNDLLGHGPDEIFLDDDLLHDGKEE